MIPVIYCLDEDSLEAIHTLFFCSTQCRETALIERRVESDGPFCLGTGGEWIDRTVCDECGKEVK